MTIWGRIGVFDLETTGIDVETSRIVSACIAILDESGDLVTRWDWLADPGIEIPEGASAVHGITTERARAEGRSAAQVVAEIAQTLRALFALGIPLVVYNAPYDLSLLDRESRRHRLEPLAFVSPVIDPLVLDKAVDRYRKGKRTLEVTAELYGVSLDDAHDAGSDAIAAGRVALALARAYPEQLALAATELHDRQTIWHAEQAASFQDYIRTTKGDSSFVSDTGWPIRLAEHPLSYQDTQPIPAPPRRPSLTVPVFDPYGTGTLALEPPVSLGTEKPRASEPEPRASEQGAGEPGASEPRVAAPRFAEPAPSALPKTYATAPMPRVSRPTVLRVAAAIVSDENGRTLLVRKAGSASFMQAGGKIEPGESALDALARELSEEIGLVLDPDHTEYIGSFRAEAANEPNTVIRAEVFALVTSAVPMAAGEIEELVWIDEIDAGGLDLAPLTRDTILPLWHKRRSALF